MEFHFFCQNVFKCILPRLCSYSPLQRCKLVLSFHRKTSTKCLPLNYEDVDVTGTYISGLTNKLIDNCPSQWYGANTVGGQVFDAQGFNVIVYTDMCL
jgi:hypothetical protein